MAWCQSLLTGELQLRVQLILKLFPIDGGTATAWGGDKGDQLGPPAWEGTR